MIEQNFIGCDPGDKGAFCLLRVFSGKPPEIHFLDGDVTRTEMLAWFKEIDENITVRMAVLEDVKSIFGVSAKSNFGFGRSVERAHFVLDIQPFGMALATPKVWQKTVGVVVPTKKKKAKPKPTGGIDCTLVPVEKPKKAIGNNILIKKEVERLCNQLYPGCDIYGPKGGLKDGRSDALMIAHYCMLKYKL